MHAFCTKRNNLEEAFFATRNCKTPATNMEKRAYCPRSSLRPRGGMPSPEWHADSTHSNVKRVTMIAMDECICTNPTPFVPITVMQSNGVLLCTTPAARVLPQLSHHIQVINLKLSKLHLHNDLELEGEDLHNIVIRNVAHVGIVDIVEVAEEDGVGMPTWATFWLAMPNLIIPILPVRPSGRHSLPGLPRNYGKKLAVVLA
jgi:hypothetical protein